MSTTFAFTHRLHITTVIFFFFLVASTIAAPQTTSGSPDTENNTPPPDLPRKLTVKYKLEWVYEGDAESSQKRWGEKERDWDLPMDMPIRAELMQALKKRLGTEDTPIEWLKPPQALFVHSGYFEEPDKWNRCWFGKAAENHQHEIDEHTTLNYMLKETFGVSAFYKKKSPLASGFERVGALGEVGVQEALLDRDSAIPYAYVNNLHECSLHPGKRVSALDLHIYAAFKIKGMPPPKGVEEAKMNGEDANHNSHPPQVGGATHSDSD